MTKSCGKVVSDQELSLEEGDDRGHLYKKRKFADDVPSVEWQQPQSLDCMAVALKGLSSHRSVKRQIRDPSPPSICPAVIMIDDDTSTDDAARCAVASTATSSPNLPGVEDGGALSDVEWPFSRSAYTDFHESAMSPEPTDVAFEQFIRLPSSSPPPLASPGDAGSELSGDTLVVTPSDECVEISPPSVDSLLETNPAEVHVVPAAPNPEDDHCVGSAPRIRLRVNQPKIRLHLRLHGTSFPGRKAKVQTKQKTGKGGTRKGDQKKTGKGGARRGKLNKTCGSSSRKR